MQVSETGRRDDSTIEAPSVLVFKLRTGQGLSQNGLADLVGCSQATISRIEAGLSPVLPALAAPLAELLGTTRQHLRPDVFGHPDGKPAL